MSEEEDYFVFEVDVDDVLDDSFEILEVVDASEGLHHVLDHVALRVFEFDHELEMETRDVTQSMISFMEGESFSE